MVSVPPVCPSGRAARGGGRTGRRYSPGVTTTEIPTRDSGAADPDPSRSLRFWPVALVLALVFLGGAVGYLVGVRSSGTPSGAVDVGFLNDMSDHHDQAVTMGLLALATSDDPVVRGFAQDVVVFQRSELGTMSAYLSDQDTARLDYDAERPVMAWMGMSTTLSTMPGMASEEDLARLREARGPEFDLLFLQLMRAHHEGGIHMATYAAENASDPRVRELAARMARNQEIEVREYDAHLDRLDRASAT